PAGRFPALAPAPPDGRVATPAPPPGPRVPPAGNVLGRPPAVPRPGCCPGPRPPNRSAVPPSPYGAVPRCDALCPHFPPAGICEGRFPAPGLLPGRLVLFQLLRLKLLLLLMLISPCPQSQSPQ